MDAGRGARGFEEEEEEEASQPPRSNPVPRAGGGGISVAPRVEPPRGRENGKDILVSSRFALVFFLR